jgi:alpha-amylase/alpha-mannosidase (GH57 family)
MRWAATDEGVLARSLERFPLSEEERHRPYLYREEGILVYFRDRELSDRIGFVYSSWDPERAADDLIGRLLGVRERLGRKEASACVSIILDGENPWEYYPDSGLGFLSRFYRLLASTPGLEAVRMGDPSMREPRRERLTRIVPGSWIDANFDTWIGVPEKNRAWRCLSSARHKLAVEAPTAPVPREFYRAEGSDWFWWLGPGHDTPYEASYENLFRMNLLEGLRKAGIEPPDILKTTARLVPTPRFQPPLHLFSPEIDGKRGNYYDWIAAGFYRSSEGSTHRASRLLEQIRFGFDRETFYLRVEGDLEAVRKAGSDVSLTIEIFRPSEMEFTFNGGSLTAAPRGGNGQTGPAAARRESRGKAAIGEVVEASLPLEELSARAGQALDFAVSLRVGMDLIERLPQSGYVCVTVPPPDYGRDNWSV